jgi:transcriptional regulator with XRE-family HTH domain
LKSVFTKEYEALVRTLIEERKKRGLTQADIAHRLGRPQSFVSKYERGERRLDVVEFIYVAKTVGISAAALIRKLEDAQGSSSPTEDPE